MSHRSAGRTRVTFIGLLAAALALVGLTGLVVPASAAPQAQVSGTVTDVAGAPIRGIRVDVARWNEEFGGWQTAGETTTKRDGTWSVRNIPAGDYQVRFFDITDTYAYEYWDDAFLDIDATTIAIAPGEVVTGIDAELDLAGELGGVVTDAEGQPLEDVLVEMRRFIGDDPYYFGATITNAEGRWRHRGLEPGATYYVQFSDPISFETGEGGDYVGEFWDDEPTVYEADPLVLDAGEVRSDIDAQLADAGHITGTVTRPDGITPIPFITVEVTRQAGDGWEVVDPDAFFSTDEDGTFDVGGLPTGTYRVQFRDEFEGIWQDEWYDDATAEAPTVVTVTGGATVVGIDASLARTSTPVAFENLEPPSISGRAVVGRTLTASPGEWTPTGATFAYEWLADGEPVGTGTTYAPTAADVGKSISVQVTAASPDFDDGVATSDEVGPVKGPGPR
jgi:5-hydroxyisourate hydrolase-like protein (transthyretin family)